MIYVTLGDPFGVSIEILHKLRDKLEKSPVPLVLIGSYWQWEKQAEVMGLVKWQPPLVTKIAALTPGVYFWNLETEADQRLPSNLSLKQRGSLAVRALDALRELKLSSADVIVTAPIDKKNCQLAGFTYPGQTEFFEELGHAEGIMILAGPKLKVGLVTNHLALSDVPGALHLDLIEAKTIKLAQSLHRIYGIEQPKIAVTGLNPHCGDGGMFGQEDQQIIEPAVRKVRHQGFDAVGPIPADTAFFLAYSGRYDAVLAMYHDQGLGPLKTVHFYDAVNITGGLSFLRVSPDHGPASDLFGSGFANQESFEQALDIGFKYTEHME